MQEQNTQRTNEDITRQQWLSHPMFDSGRRAEFCFLIFERRGVRVGVFERVCIGFEVLANRTVQGGAKS